MILKGGHFYTIAHAVVTLSHKIISLLLPIYNFATTVEVCQNSHGPQVEDSWSRQYDLGNPNSLCKSGVIWP